jgi:hypothetical protein
MRFGRRTFHGHQQSFVVQLRRADLPAIICPDHHPHALRVVGIGTVTVTNVLIAPGAAS